MGGGAKNQIEIHVFRYSESVFDVISPIKRKEVCGGGGSSSTPEIHLSDNFDRRFELGPFSRTSFCLHSVASKIGMLQSIDFDNVEKFLILALYLTSHF